ncbi:TerD family protein [Clostridium sp. DL1XJH146]
MGVNLQKGQRVDLVKHGDSLSKVIVGLGWDPVQTGGKGLLGGLFGGGNSEVDCDASVLMLDANGKLAKSKDVIYFGNLKSIDGSVVHTGDNLTGDGDGDDEQIIVDLQRVPSAVEKLVFVVNIYDCLKRKQDFGMIQNAFIRVFNPANNNELIKYNLSENYSGKTALITGEIYRNNGGWKFAAVGEGTNDSGLRSIINRYK